MSVIERVLLQFEKRLPSTDIKELLVTPEGREPQEELERLFADPDDPEIRQRFQKAARAERTSSSNSSGVRKRTYGGATGCPSMTSGWSCW